MNYRDLIDGAIAIVCENASVTFGNEDYYARAPYLLAAFVTQYAQLDADYRKAHGMEDKVISTDAATVNPDAEFPLCDVFAPAAIYHLASGLVIDENEEMSDKFFDRYINTILDIRKALPTLTTAIVDRYGLI
jgi:hypothetical protein